jgi:cation diffusion facilitator family transporter
MEGPSRTRVLGLSLFAIISVVFVEGIAGLFVNSLALMSDAVHASLDAVTTLILLLATRWALKPPDEEHMYGHAKIESIGGLVGGLILVFLSVVLVAEAGIRLMAGPTPINPGSIGFGAALYTLAIDFFRIGILRKTSASLTVKADLFHALADLSSTLIALVGIAAASLGFYSGDVLASLVLCSLLIYLSSKLIRSASMDLTDAVPRDLAEAVETELTRMSEISGFTDLKMRKVGSKTYVHVTATVPDYVNVEDAHSIASRIESSIGKIVGDSSVTVHVEPTPSDVPLDVSIDRTSRDIAGVKDVHNVNVHRTADGVYVTLHIQVDPKASLLEAHRIAEEVEKNLRDNLDVKEATVHIESFEQDTSWGRIVHDPSMLTAIDELVKRNTEIKRVNKTILYVAEERLHINVNCSFRNEMPVEKLHDIITAIEDDLRKRFEGATVTIHPEPYDVK